MCARTHEVVWQVHVQMPAWTWMSPQRLRDLGEAVARDPHVRAVLEVWPLRWRLYWRLFPNDLDPYVKVEVAADTPGRASAKAEAAVSGALAECGADPTAQSWIIETDSVPA